MKRNTKRQSILQPAAEPDWRAEAEARGRAAFEAAVADPEPTADSNAWVRDDAASRDARAVTKQEGITVRIRL